MERLLFPVLDLLSDSEQPLQRKLMAELHPQLFSETTDSSAQFLMQWLQQQAIKEGPSLSRTEVEWILARANSKNSLVNYSREQMQTLIAQADTSRRDQRWAALPAFPYPATLDLPALAGYAALSVILLPTVAEPFR